MKTQWMLLACALASFSPALPPAAAQTPAAQAADTPAVAVVRQFLADRASGNSAAAYSLLHLDAGMHMTEQKYAAGSMPPRGTPKQMSDPVYGFVILLADTHNTFHYTFTVIGIDPKDPHTVLVRALPPASAAGVSPVTVRVVTADDPATHAPRLDVLASLKRDAPEVFAKADENVKRAQSLNNLKFLGLAIVEYAQDHDDVMPDAAHWVDEIMPYIKSTAPFHDPSAPAGQKYSYAYNANLSRKNWMEVDSHPATVLLFESTKGVKNASDTGQSVPRPGRHKGRTNSASGTDFLFGDTHAKWLPNGTKPSFKLSGK